MEGRQGQNKSLCNPVAIRGEKDAAAKQPTGFIFWIFSSECLPPLGATLSALRPFMVEEAAVSRVAQWTACWAHNPKVRMDKGPIIL